MSKVQILVPPPAVLKNGEPDAHGMNRYFNWMADHGVDGLFINGSTGEFTRLTDDQKVETLRIAKESVGRCMYLIAGAITGSADLTCRLAARYKEYGADAIAVAPPYYFKHDQESIKAFQLEVAERSVLPVYLYDIPAFSNGMSFETIVELSTHPNIIGLKDSSRDFSRFELLLSTIKKRRPEFKIYTGTEELLLVSLIMGADGATIATAGIVPDLVRRLADAFEKGDLAEAKKVQFELLPMIRKWASKDFPEGFRDAVAELGFL